MSRLSDLGSGYRYAIQRLRACCTRVEVLHRAARIGVTDCELIYESAFLNAVARFEGLLNDLLTEFVCGPNSSKPGRFPLVKPRSRPAFRTVFTAGRAYVDLMPFKTCLDVSKRFLNDAKPFSEVDAADQNVLAQAVLVRNAIAHRSDSALTRFRRDVVGVSLLPPHRRFPGSHLRRVYRAHPTQTWNDLYLDTLEKVGMQLATGW